MNRHIKQDWIFAKFTYTAMTLLKKNALMLLIEVDLSSPKIAFINSI